MNGLSLMHFIPADIEVEWKRKDGTAMKVRRSGRQVAIEDGAPHGCVVMAEDITAQRASEDYLRN